MGNIVIFHPDKEPEFLESVNTPDYCDLPPEELEVDENTGKIGVKTEKDRLHLFAKPGVVINPDLSALEGIPKKFWKRDGKKVIEMTKAEKKAVKDREDAETEVLFDKFENVDAITLAKALIKVGAMTKEQLKQAVKEVKND